MPRGGHRPGAGRKKGQKSAPKAVASTREIKDEGDEAKNATAITVDMVSKIDVLCENVARRAISRITDEKLDKTSATSLMTVAGIAIDKTRLLRDQSTANIATNGRVTHGYDDLRKLSRDEIRRLQQEALGLSETGGGEGPDGIRDVLVLTEPAALGGPVVQDIRPTGT